MAGEYLHSFAATDVCSGWVEEVSLLAREQGLVIEGLKRMPGQVAGKARRDQSQSADAQSLPSRGEE